MTELDDLLTQWSPVSIV